MSELNIDQVARMIGKIYLEKELLQEQYESRLESKDREIRALRTQIENNQSCAEIEN